MQTLTGKQNIRGLQLLPVLMLLIKELINQKTSGLRSKYSVTAKIIQFKEMAYCLTRGQGV